jgi:thiamine pyrophosphate-dependent acetolactate synthase large subunit-like protein
MELRPVLEALQAARTNEVVISTMGPAREWMELGSHPLDFVFVPSSMGQGTALALGLALARPERRIVSLCGDGSVLMNLGSLVTITAHAPANLTILLFDNGVYEVTGAQLTPGAAERRQDGRDIDFVALARACGFARVEHYDAIERWRANVRSILAQPGPMLVVLSVKPVPDACGPRSPGPAPDRVRAFAEALTAR